MAGRVQFQLFPTWGGAREVLPHRRKGPEVCPSLLPHSCLALQPRVTSWRLNHGHPGCGWSEATGSRCLAPLRPRCSWRPAAPARLGPRPESVLASRQSGRRNAACSMSGRPEPGSWVRETAGRKPSLTSHQGAGPREERQDSTAHPPITVTGFLPFITLWSLFKYSRH